MKKLLVCFSMMIATPVMANPTFPTLQGKPVLDAANVIPDDQEVKLNERLFEIMRQSKHQVMVLTVPSLEGHEIDEYGIAAGRFYGVGSRDANDGILFTIAPNEHKMRIDIGRGMESIITDANVHDITTAVKPYFKNNDFAGGINHGVDDIAAKIVPLSPEQIALRKKADENAVQRTNMFFSHMKDFAVTLFGIVLAGLGGFGLYRLATIPKRQREREEAERCAAEQKLQRERDQAERRVQEVENETRMRAEEARNAARLKENARMERQRVAAQAAKRSAMLAAMSMTDRAVFLQSEEDAQKAADRETARKEAYVKAQQQEEQKRQADEAERQAEIYREQRKREAQEQQEQSSYSSSSYSSSSSSSSSDSFSGGGGSFGGGGGSDSW